MTLQERIERLHFTFECEEVGENPNMADMPCGSRHYLCLLTHTDEVIGNMWEAYNATLEIFFSMGPALEREPTAEDVLDCLASDAAIYENDEIDELGLSWRQGKAIEEQTKRLRDWAGDEYEGLLWETERQ